MEFGVDKQSSVDSDISYDDSYLNCSSTSYLSHKLYSNIPERNFPLYLSVGLKRLHKLAHLKSDGRFLVEKRIFYRFVIVEFQTLAKRISTWYLTLRTYPSGVFYRSLLIYWLIKLTNWDLRRKIHGQGFKTNSIKRKNKKNVTSERLKTLK